MPDGRAEFNVAIRTLTIDGEKAEARYHVGSGITWDAAPDAEYQECLDKAAIVLRPRPAFDLLETLRFEDGVFALLEEHLARLEESANYFDFPFDRDAILQTLQDSVAGCNDSPQRVRLTLRRDGVAKAETVAIPPSTGPWRIALAQAHVQRNNVFLYHKTTHRAVYEAARSGRPNVDDVLLFNEDGELTESTVANVILEIDGRRFTPARACGLLAGTLRSRMLASGEIEEAVLNKDDLERATRISLINSVRGEIAATLVP